MKKSNLLRIVSFLTMIALLGACQTPDLEVTPDVDPIEANADWTDATHSNLVEPDYAVIFPQDRVNTLEIAMTAAQWKSIQSDMTANSYGTFGASSSGGGGNPPGQTGGGDPAYVALSLKFNGKTWDKVGFRLKGNSSLSTAWRSGVYKLPFRLKFDEFEDQYSEIKNQRLYGFQELSMSPAYSDYSLIREKVAADLFRLGGVPAAQTAFYQVYIDFGEGRKYCGVYTMVEVIDDTMVKNQFGEDDGNIYKPESTFQTFVESQFEIKNNKTDADYADVKAFVSALNNGTRTTDPAQWRSSLEQTFNVNHYLKFLAINNTLVNWDTYGAMAHNYYLYNSPTGKLTWIPWDHNESMSGTSGGGGGRSAVSLAMTEVSASWPLLRYVANDPVYYAQYKLYVREFSDTVFIPSQVNALLDRYHSLISPYVIGPEATETGKYSYLSRTSDFTTALTTLKTHISTRSQAAITFVK